MYNFDIEASAFASLLSVLGVKRRLCHIPVHLLFQPGFAEDSGDESNSHDTGVNHSPDSGLEFAEAEFGFERIDLCNRIKPGKEVVLRLDEER